MELNEYQKNVVDHVDGPCVVTSCPGSGKTAVLVERVCSLINKGINPKNILCLTFTNKAANEMKERICKKLGLKKTGFFIGTFHSLCSLIIRTVGHEAGYSNRFSILDDKDQQDLISQISRQMEYDINAKILIHIAYCLNYYRDQLEDFSWVEDKIKNNIDLEIAKNYLEHCRENNLLDFSGLIYETIKIIENNESIRNKIQNTFRYILVDETQDTNKSQFHLVTLLGDKYKNIMIIGDPDQCVIEGEKISISSNEYKKIEDIKKGDIVLSGAGKGKTVDAKVENVYKKNVVDYPAVKICTKSGNEVTFTKEHVVFAGYVKDSPKKIIVYLMYDREFGYRVGVTNTKRKHGFNSCGIGARVQQERAEYLWILKAVDSIDEAKYWEQYYSVEYGLPTWCFYSEKKNRKMDYSDESIKKLFSSIDTASNANKLMEDLWIFKDRPHYIPKCMCKNKRRNFTVNMCADSRYGSLHRYMVSGSNDEDRTLLKQSGLNVRDAGKGKRGWRIDSAFKSLGDVYDVLDKVRGCLGEVNIIEKARLGYESLNLIPSSNLREGMGIYVEKEGVVDIDFIESVEHILYTGNVYDLDINMYHNFITNKIFSHNSIYGWRGARFQNIQDFINRYENCKIISLSKNYRSTPQIIKVASKLIDYNNSHMKIKFETNNSDGENVRCRSFENQIEEAEWVGHTVKRLIREGGWDPEDVAVLYRMNKMSEPIEQAFVNNGISYEVIGAYNFYDRKEVKDCLAMARLLSNPNDGVSFHRVAGLVGDIGNITIGRIEKFASSQKMSLIEACREIIPQIKTLRTRASCNSLYETYSKEFDFNNPSVCFSNLINSLKYNDYLEKEYGEKAPERKENIEQIINSSGEFNGESDGLTKYLQQVSLFSPSDKENKDKKVSLMSLHSSKGLEFPIVFIIGVEDGILPHKQAIADDPYHGLEEERRLAYVGITRAKKILYLSWCQKRKKFGMYGKVNYEKSKPSRFLFETELYKKHE